MEHRIGGLIALLVLAAVGLVLYSNLQPREPRPVTPQLLPGKSDSIKGGAGFNVLGGIETPIGQEIERNGMLIAAAWLPPIRMEGEDLPQHENIIHLEADIHALEGNRNGFGLGAWIPYLTIAYEIRPVDDSGETLTGEFQPMVAKDGPHYGATIEMPGPGKYLLVYRIENPSKKNFGRHSDPITGVDPWWDPFEVRFDFDYSGSPSSRAMGSPVKADAAR